MNALWRKRAARGLLNLAAAVVIVLALFASTGVALAQTSRTFSLGCWAVPSAGATGGLYASATWRMKYAVTSWGATETQGAPASTNFRLRSNHFAARALAVPPGQAGTPPAGPNFTFLPAVWGRIVNLAGLNACR